MIKELSIPSKDVQFREVLISSHAGDVCRYVQSFDSFHFCLMMREEAREINEATADDSFLLLFNAEVDGTAMS